MRIWLLKMIRTSGQMDMNSIWIGEDSITIKPLGFFWKWFSPRHSQNELDHYPHYLAWGTGQDYQWITPGRAFRENQRNTAAQS
jgi:hypothetical protein